MKIIGLKGVIFDWGRTIHKAETDAFFPETKEVLERCSQKYRLAIASICATGDMTHRFELLEQAGLRRYFDFVLFDFRDKEVLIQDIINNWGIKNEEVAVIDDRIKRLTWPIRNHCKTIWLKKGKYASEAPDEDAGQPDVIISSLEEILKLI